jgi:Zn-dependent protease
VENTVADGALWYTVFLASTICHEAAHAWAGRKLGDDTASRGGQESLNPIPHVRREPIGMVVVPLLAWFTSGWMMGWASAPFNADWARRLPRRAAMVALAGPAANLALVLAAALLVRVGIEWNVFDAPYSLGMERIVSAVAPGFPTLLAKILSISFSLNLLLCVFNLLPIPPLDGGSLPLLFLPENTARKYFDAVRSPVIQIVGLLIIMRGLGSYFTPILTAAASLLHPGSHYN